MSLPQCQPWRNTNSQSGWLVQAQRQIPILFSLHQNNCVSLFTGAYPNICSPLNWRPRGHCFFHTAQMLRDCCHPRQLHCSPEPRWPCWVLTHGHTAESWATVTLLSAEPWPHCWVLSWGHTPCSACWNPGECGTLGQLVGWQWKKTTSFGWCASFLSTREKELLWSYLWWIEAHREGHKPCPGLRDAPYIAGIIRDALVPGWNCDTVDSISPTARCGRNSGLQEQGSHSWAAPNVQYCQKLGIAIP